MQSPITGNTTVKLIDEIDSKIVIDLYKKELNMEVSRFFENIPKIQILQCEQTGYRFYAPFSLAGDGDFYADLQQKYKTYYREWKWENEFASKELTKDMNVLEIGCGRGAFLLNIRDKVNAMVGLELNMKAIEMAKAEGLDVRNELIDVHAANNPEKYDLICFFQVLEHINEVKDFLDAALKALKVGGKLIIGVPNSDPYLLKYDKFHTLNLPPHHAGLWNKAAFQQLEKYFPMKLEKVGYEPLRAIGQQWKLVLAHKKQNFLLSIANIIPNIFYKAAGKLVGGMFEGTTIVTVFIKK